ncbi:MAG TPA: carboxypeptidase-like regulatory domain-containing protein [Blastocatellia bacterium]|nr:carboxypeptidase-like regulatory domain-containing protein [Blastocatellia bacterium]
MTRKTSYAIILSVVLTLVAALPSLAQSASGAIRGKVKEQDGKALEGVKVLVRKIETKSGGDQTASRASSQGARLAESSFKRETETSSKGEFAFADLEPGNYALTFEKQGFVTITTWQIEVKAGETVQFGRTIELAREKQVESSLIRGAVFNHDGFTFPNATVRIERIGGGRKFKRETNSAEGGEFAFRVPSEKGTYRITASADGFQTAVKEIEVDAAEVRQISLTLEKKP